MNSTGINPQLVNYMKTIRIKEKTNTDIEMTSLKGKNIAAPQFVSFDNKSMVKVKFGVNPVKVEVNKIINGIIMNKVTTITPIDFTELLFSKKDKENPDIENMYQTKYSTFLNDVRSRMPLMEIEYKKLINIMAYNATVVGQL